MLSGIGVGVRGFMQGFRFGVALAAVLVGASPAGAQLMPLEQAAKMFGAREGSFAADLSPLGDKVVYLSADGGSRTVVKLLDLASLKERRIIASDGKHESLQSCEFATESWIVCQYGGTSPYLNLVITFGRLAAIDLDKNQIKPLGVRADEDRDTTIRQKDGRILDFILEGSGGSVLMARNHVPQQAPVGEASGDTAGGLGVDRIDLASMRASTVEAPRPDASQFMTDGQGSVRLVGLEQIARNGEQLSGQTKFHFRVAGSKSWRDLGEFDSRDNSGMWPLAIDRSNDSLYYLQKRDGRDALFTMKLDGSNTSTLVAKNDRVDISSVLRVGRGQPVIGYRYSDERPRIEYFDPTFRKLASALGRALPNTPIIEFAGSSRDAAKVLVHGSGDTSPGTFYVLDRASRQMPAILLDRPELDEKTLSPVRSISYRAADGTQIPAYLTMPKGAAGTKLPAVVMPHGGPSSRDEWGFDWLAQFLASQGYVVIQPNYRGSAGFGDEFLGENAFRDWRKAISDIHDSGDYLVTQGIADPKRMAILGWSYGGYAALQSAVTDPDRYKAVIAIAPVTDLSALRRDAEGFTNENLTKDFIGKDDNLRSGSPLHHASAIKAPVLLVHGDLDGNVRVAHSQRMEAALRKAGTPVEFLRYKQVEHQLDDSDVRTEMLAHIGAMLDKTIGH